jgi:hypothetical protein
MERDRNPTLGISVDTRSWKKTSAAAIITTILISFGKESADKYDLYPLCNK